MRGDREDRSVIHRQLSVERSPIRGDRENVSPRSTQNEVLRVCVKSFSF